MKAREQIARFIRQNDEVINTWDYDRTIDWVGWHLAHQHVIVAWNKDHKSLCGLLICRPVMKPSDGNEWYVTDPEGPCVYVDELICLRDTAMEALFEGAVKRFGMRPWIAWKRAPKYVIKFRDAERVERLVFRKENVYYGSR